MQTDPFFLSAHGLSTVFVHANPKAPTTSQALLTFRTLLPPPSFCKCCRLTLLFSSHPVFALCKLLAGRRRALGCESPIDFGKRRGDPGRAAPPRLAHLLSTNWFGCRDLKYASLIIPLADCCGLLLLPWLFRHCWSETTGHLKQQTSRLISEIGEGDLRTLTFERNRRIPTSQDTWPTAPTPGVGNFFD